MFLKQIKLAGFKSFVDPTVIPIRSAMSAIVGPNGCGKSNIVDAIRWVVGESSAKQLRGQSMSDVIFNGTTARKPLGRAMVELTFDNSDHRLTGEYAAYAEISVRREVSREGQSSYYLNGTQCRRRDVLDIFLGTGLGPRSYSIIEQGMISRLVEAKPEELRVYLEEAAGISKYKERRRETENRMRHTQDNMDRVNDLCEELDRQLRHLQRQAKSAEKYKLYKEEERKLDAELKVLHWQVYDTDLKQLCQQLEQASRLLEEERTQLAQVEAKIETQRLTHTETGHEHSETQKQFYSLATDVSRIEQQLEHIKSQSAQWQQEMASLTERGSQLSQAHKHHQQQLSIHQEQIARLTPSVNEASEVVAAAMQRLSEAEKSQQSSQDQWDHFSTEVAQCARKVDVDKTNLSHLERQAGSSQHKLNQLKQQCEKIELSSQEHELVELRKQADQVADKLSLHESEMQKLSTEIVASRQAIQDKQKEQQTLRGEAQALTGRLASLEALQQAAFKDDDKHTANWLHAQGLQEAKRVGECLSVAGDWQSAVEAVLFDSFSAIVTETPEQYLQTLGADMTHGLVLVEELKNEQGKVSPNGVRTMADVVKAHCQLPLCLQSVYLAEDWQEAKTLLPSLSENHSILTKQGLWLGKGWLRTPSKADAKRGVLKREQEIKAAQVALAALSEKIEAFSAALKQEEPMLRTLESQRDSLQRDYQGMSRELSQAKSTLSAKETAYQSQKNRRQQLEQEIEQVARRSEQLAQSIVQAQTGIAQQENEQQQLLAQRESLLEAREQWREQVRFSREALQQARQQLDEYNKELTMHEHQADTTRQLLARDDEQRQHLAQRQMQLEAQMGAEARPVAQLETELQEKLAARQAHEVKLKQLEATVLQLEQEIAELEKMRQRSNAVIHQQQTELQQLQMDQQTLKVKQSAIDEQLQAQELTLAPILENMTENATIAGHSEALETLAKRVSRLGPINLAAIEEYDEVKERRDFLGAQQADLEEALNALSSAIQKIDRETRETFKKTYDVVSTQFSSMFPKVFGGGRAAIEWTGDDVLTAGLQVKAQPPGKRNATIHMLSGGEKALTAIALVFALFHLNPAPFCVLDEVDAPLDDLNVSRYCQLVKEMSDKTQFLVISHNKVTIEAAGSLLGVTMHEPGVSRLVAVDIDEAVAMAEA